jgi:hypothetical protein
MRLIATFLGAAVLLFPLAPGLAAERASMLSAGELKEKPFSDSATLAKLPAKQQVGVVKRQGGWANVEATGKTGWVRLLSLRLEAGAVPTRVKTAAASRLHTGSSAKTVTTGVKGMTAEDIKNAAPNYAELELMGRLGVPADQATANAKQSGLAEHQIAYLKERGK